VIGTIPVVQWVTASPLWSAAASDAATMQRPSILRFASDTFMPDLVGMLERRPADLADVVAEPRSYRPQPPGAPAGWLPSLPDLKLYQAAHGHFNLVAASLVCRLPGMPDRTLDTASEEVVGFVLRRLVPSEGDSPIESAWVDDPNAGRGWRPVAGQERRVASSEELLPLFALNYATDRARRLFVGLIPTSSGDTF
jgi:hypothetical protein